MLQGIFQTKTPEELLRTAEGSEGSLRRALGPLQITLLGVGAIIGAGIFTTVGTATAGDAARPGAGPSLMLSFVITAVVCAFTALCYAEFASKVPVSGSAYTYSYATLGELVAWIIGWDLIIEYAIGNVAVAISWAGYFRNLLDKLLGMGGMQFPMWLATDYRTAAKAGLLDQAPKLFGVPIVFNLLAFSIVMFITLVLVWGIRESARFNAVMVIIKVLVLMFFVGLALAFVSPTEMAANWTPFQPNGWAGTFAGAAVVFFAYIGFDAVSTVAEETKNPKRDLPIGIFASLAICTLLYVVVSAVFIGIMPYQELIGRLATERAEPLTMALDFVAPNSSWASGLVAFGSVVAMTAVLLVFQLGQPRIFFSMARDGLLPQAFARIHPRYKTPHITTIFTGLIVGLIAGVANIDEMVDLTNIGTLFAFVLVCIGIPLLRRREERGEVAATDGGFRVPSVPVLGYWLLPLLGAASCVFLMFYLPPSSWWRFIGWLMLGMATYSVYGFAHSTVGRRMGRTASTPPALSWAAVGFFLSGVAMIFVLPHDVGLAKLATSLFSTADLPRATLGGWLTLLGLALAGVGWRSALRRKS